MIKLQDIFFLKWGMVFELCLIFFNLVFLCKIFFSWLKICSNFFWYLPNPPLSKIQWSFPNGFTPELEITAGSLWFSNQNPVFPKFIGNFFQTFYQLNSTDGVVSSLPGHFIINLKMNNHLVKSSLIGFNQWRGSN